MKTYLFTLLLSVSFLQLFAQNETLSFQVNGVKVIFRPTQKETVSVRMYYRGGVTNYDAQQSGIENLALSTAATCGTKNYTVEDYHELADEYGIDISGGSKKDYGVIGMDCINTYFEQGWKLFTDAIINPTFDNSEFQKEKEKIISAAYSRYANPEIRMDQLAAEAIFKESIYSVDPFGTNKTLAGFTADSVKQYYYENLLNKNKMFLVVAGNISKEELQKKISAAFITIPQKSYVAPLYEEKALEGVSLFTENKALTTNYMSCVMNAPKFNSPDFYPFAFGINALSGYLYYEVRSKQGLSYNPGATIELQQIPYASMYVSTTQPKKAVIAMTNVYRNILAGNLSQEFLNGMKKNYRSQYYSQQESSSAIVDNLGESEILGGFELYVNKMQAIDQVSLQDIKPALTKYLKGSRWIYIGSEELAKDAFR